GEADDPVAVLVFRNPYWLADERLTDEDEVAGPFDLTLAAYPPHRVIGVVPRFFDVIRVWPCRCAVAASGRGLVKCLVRSLVVVMHTEAVEAALLLLRGCSWRARRLLLERTVNALVPSILVRSTRFNALELDPELDPFDRQPAQPTRPIRCKRRSVVRANRPRQPELAERPSEARLHSLRGRRHDPAGNQKAAVGVADRQRIATLAVGGAEPAFEVGTPRIVGRRRECKRLSDRSSRPTPP